MIFDFVFAHEKFFRIESLLFHEEKLHANVRRFYSPDDADCPNVPPNLLPLDQFEIFHSNLLFDLSVDESWIRVEVFHADNRPLGNNSRIVRWSFSSLDSSFTPYLWQEPLSHHFLQHPSTFRHCCILLHTSHISWLSDGKRFYVTLFLDKFEARCTRPVSIKAIVMQFLTLRLSSLFIIFYS